MIVIIESWCICSCHNANVSYKNWDNRSRVSIMFIVDSGPMRSEPPEVTAQLLFFFLLFLVVVLLTSTIYLTIHTHKSISCECQKSVKKNTLPVVRNIILWINPKKRLKLHTPKKACRHFRYPVSGCVYVPNDMIIEPDISRWPFYTIIL